MNKNIEIMNLISKEGKSKEEVKNYIIEVIETMGFTGALHEIKGNRNSLKNAMYAVNTFCNDKLAKRYDVNTRKCVWQPTQEKINSVEYFRKQLTDLCNYALDDNTSVESEYLKLKNDFANIQFEIAQYYKLLEDTEDDIEKYMELTEGIKPLQEKLNQAENNLDLFVMKNFR